MKTICILTLILFYGCGKINEKASLQLTADDSSKSFTKKVFPDFEDQVPADYKGRLFKLSQDYPDSLPKENLPWLSFDFKIDEAGYLNAIKQYVYEGMTDADWEVSINKVRKWYHVPWMHVGRHPRECIFGMTRERNSLPYELDPKQVDTVQNWAVGFYNPIGGYTIGQIWKDPANPRVDQAQFKEGTVVAKLLFTAADTNQVPIIAGSFERQANINSTIGFNSPKAVKIVRLLQMDVAIKDSRANSTTGWVFATFEYDRNSKASLPIQKMVPVGLAWGNDPSITAKEVAEGKKLTETIIDKNIPEYGKRRLGWGGRLNGAVDNSISSCLSCHSTSEWKPITESMTPNGTDVQKLLWFRNLKGDQPFDDGEVALDYSLQLSVAFQNFYNPQLNPSAPATTLDTKRFSNKQKKAMSKTQTILER